MTFQIYKLFGLEKSEFLIVTITECAEIGMGRMNNGHGRNVHETVFRLLHHRDFDGDV